MLPPMQYSEIGLALTEQFESCRLTAYPDVKSVWTIGWGHTGPEVVPGLVWTQERADAQLLKDIQHAVDTVKLCSLTTQVRMYDDFYNGFVVMGKSA